MEIKLLIIFCLVSSDTSLYDQKVQYLKPFLWVFSRMFFIVFNQVVFSTTPH